MNAVSILWKQTCLPTLAVLGVLCPQAQCQDDNPNAFLKMHVEQFSLPDGAYAAGQDLLRGLGLENLEVIFHSTSIEAIAGPNTFNAILSFDSIEMTREMEGILTSRYRWERIPHPNQRQYILSNEGGLNFVAGFEKRKLYITGGLGNLVLVKQLALPSAQVMSEWNQLHPDSDFRLILDVARLKEQMKGTSFANAHFKFAKIIRLLESLTPARLLTLVVKTEDDPFIELCFDCETAADARRLSQALKRTETFVPSALWSTGTARLDLVSDLIENSILEIHGNRALIRIQTPEGLKESLTNSLSEVSDVIHFRAPRLIQISDSTTWITKPQRSGSHEIDYVAFFNNKMSSRVVGDNAVVDYIRILGTGELRNDQLLKQSAWLKSNGLSRRKSRLRPLDDSLKELIASGELTPKLVSSHAQALTWLKENEDVLDQIVEASTRPSFFFPLVDDETSPRLIATPLQFLDDVRSAALGLYVRALFSMSESEPERALRDLHAVSRVARQISNQVGLIPQIIALRLESTALDGYEKTIGLLKTPDDLQALSEQLLVVNWERDVREEINTYERAVILECAQATAGTLDPTSVVSLRLPPAAEAILKDVDWNRTLRLINGRVDELHTVMSAGNEPNYGANVLKFQQEMEASIRHFLVKPTCDGFADLFIFDYGLNGSFYLNPQEATLMRRELLSILAALRAFQVREGRVPTSLVELTPNYMTRVPMDRFLQSKPPVYRADKSNFMLYSVGPNREDDGGFDHIARGDVVVSAPVD